MSKIEKPFTVKTFAEIKSGQTALVLTPAAWYALKDNENFRYTLERSISAEDALDRIVGYMAGIPVKIELGNTLEELSVSVGLKTYYLIEETS